MLKLFIAIFFAYGIASDGQIVASHKEPGGEKIEGAANHE